MLCVAVVALVLLCSSLIAGGSASVVCKATAPLGTRVSELGTELCYIVQDKQNVYWIASNGNGLYKYNGDSLVQFTERDGLCSKYVFQLFLDTQGLLWISTRDGVCSFDGTAFRNRTKDIDSATKATRTPKQHALLFNHPKGVCFFEDGQFYWLRHYPKKHKDPTYTLVRPYGMYCYSIDSLNNVWIGTEQQGVVRLNGTSIAYHDSLGLKDAAVRSVFKDSRGTLWFGNNGAGLFRLQGSTLTNITDKHGLGNAEFLKKRMPISNAKSIARVFAINEDAKGLLWFGTVDAGIWSYDGTTLRQFSTESGLANNGCWHIGKNNSGTLLYIVGGTTIYTFNGTSFTPMVFK